MFVTAGQTAGRTITFGLNPHTASSRSLLSGIRGPLVRSHVTTSRPTRGIQTATRWRHPHILDDWVAKETRPLSLRQLLFYGRTLTEARLLASANYVRTELPTRIAHRIRDMQSLPYGVVSNRHLSQVYDLYNTAFDTFRRTEEIKTLEDNDRFCGVIEHMLNAHLSVIPKLLIGVVECADLMPAGALDHFTKVCMKSRISRRVIAEQHIALTENFKSPHVSPGSAVSESGFIGKVILKCDAKDVIERCWNHVRDLARKDNGPDVKMPEVQVDGHLSATFPYILTHLDYIIGELLRNSVQAVLEHHKRSKDPESAPPPIKITVCEAWQHVIIRVSDQGGGIPPDILPHIWSFSKGPRSKERLKNLNKVPFISATFDELIADAKPGSQKAATSGDQGSLASLSRRPPDLRLGMGLPMSRVYAEYWAGSLELHSLRGYGVDAFLQISKLGNKNEQLTSRASLDAV